MVMMLRVGLGESLMTMKGWWGAGNGSTPDDADAVGTIVWEDNGCLVCDEEDEDDHSVTCNRGASSPGRVPLGCAAKVSRNVKGGVLSFTRFLTGESWVDGISFGCLESKGIRNIH